MDKDKLRKDFKARRKAYVSGHKEALDQLIEESFFSSQLYKESSHIMAFVSFSTEVDTHNIIRRVLADGKKLYVPITKREPRELLVSRLDDFSDLVPGPYKILTPRKDKIQLVDKSVLDLILVPGLVFDKLGYRIGYGGGYYDRFLAGDLRARTLGLCYDIQLVDSLAKDDFDLPVDYILTDRSFISL